MKTNIPALRKARRVSQEELARAVGVTRQTITSIEVGKYTAASLLRKCFCLRRNDTWNRKN